MTTEFASHFLRLPTTRALAERKARLPLTKDEYKRFHAMIPEMGLKGAPFDEVSQAYPLVIPTGPRVIVLNESPRRVSVGLQDASGRFIGVSGDEIFEQACFEHPGAFLYAVGSVTERPKGDKVYLNLRPRGWVVVEVGTPGAEKIVPARKRGKISGAKKSGGGNSEIA